MNTKARSTYMLPTRDALQNQTESKGMKKGIPCKWKLKESHGSETYIKLENEDCNKRQEDIRE